MDRISIKTALMLLKPDMIVEIWIDTDLIARGPVRYIVASGSVILRMSVGLIEPVNDKLIWLTISKN